MKSALSRGLLIPLACLLVYGCPSETEEEPESQPVLGYEDVLYEEGATDGFLAKDLTDPEGFGVAAAAEDGQTRPVGRRRGAHAGSPKIWVDRTMPTRLPGAPAPSLVGYGMVLNRSALALLPWTMIWSSS